jgi:hypothetical protein
MAKEHKCPHCKKSIFLRYGHDIIDGRYLYLSKFSAILEKILNKARILGGRR